MPQSQDEKSDTTLKGKGARASHLSHPLRCVSFSRPVFITGAASEIGRSQEMAGEDDGKGRGH